MANSQTWKEKGHILLLSTTQDVSYYRLQIVSLVLKNSVFPQQTWLSQQIDIGEFNKNKKEYFKYRLADENTPLNKSIFSGDIGSPYGLLIIVPLYKDGDLEKLETELEQVAKGTKIQTSIISNILVGNLGFRKIESIHTHLYKRLQEEK